jgi:hypothetical protein
VSKKSRSRPKVQRNDLCPCLSGFKYKRCCEGRVDWDQVRRDGADVTPLLSVRGRNLVFVTKMARALQLEPGPEISLPQYRAAFTPQAVSEIHAAVLDVWPPDTDIAEVLGRMPGEVSALYVGDYRTEYLLQALVRHSTYASKILVVDPFVYPLSVEDQYNPILNPEQYRPHALKCANFYGRLMPWIQADIVNIIRTPADFDPQLQWESLRRQQKKFAENPSLQEAAERTAGEVLQRFRETDALREFLLDAPDGYLQQWIDEHPPEDSGMTREELMAYLQERRAADPDFLEPAKPGETRLTISSTGASYDIAKLTAEMSGSYLLTDLYVRWKEIEFDRDDHSAQNRSWAPFAKAVQDAPFRYLDQVRLEDALRLRQEGRLQGFRAFFHKVWREAVKGDEYDEANALALAEELQERLDEAEVEWRKIDDDLVKMVGTSVAGAVAATGGHVASAQAAFLAAAAMGGVGLTLSTRQRRRFPKQFPAAFFLDLAKRS